MMSKLVRKHLWRSRFALAAAVIILVTLATFGSLWRLG